MVRIAAALALCSLTSLSQAADNGFYLGAGITQSEYGLTNPINATPFDDEDNGYKLIVGWRPLDSFGVEASYADHGDAVLPSGIVCIALISAPCPSTTNLSAKTVSAFAVGYLDLPLLDLFAKAGVTSWQVDGRSIPSLPSFSIDDNDVEFAWGAGVQARFGSLGARLEYERFDIIADEKLGMVSLSLTWTFL
jgi:opacity protein-like surface antigen